MRLTKQQTHAIIQTVSRLAGTGAAVYLFGSRLNDQAKGGDVDLLIESDTPLSIIQRAQIKNGYWNFNLAYPLILFQNPAMR